MMVKVKICGITNVEDALVACEAGADALGFVLAPEARKRSRYITPEAAAAIIERLPSFIVTVGVVVNEPLDTLREYAAIFDRIQLHGDESPALYRALGGRAYKAFQTGPTLTYDMIAAWPGNVCLLDAFARDSRGGTGLRCDWQFAAKASQTKKIILAGGLAPDNVEEAVLLVRPYGVDASGGLECAPGKKDHERIRKFINNAKRASLA